MAKNPTIFLDRDGTVTIDHGYTVSPSGLKLFPGAPEGIAALKKSGFTTIIVTNQSAIARGLGTARDVDATNAEMIRLLREGAAGAEIDAVVYCPHHPDDGCTCRKPRTGLIENFDFDPETSWMIGDKVGDLQFGLNAGLPLEHCVLVRTGDGEKELQAAIAELGEGFVVATDLLDASRKILGHSR